MSAYHRRGRPGSRESAEVARDESGRSSSRPLAPTKPLSLFRRGVQAGASGSRQRGPEVWSFRRRLRLQRLEYEAHSSQLEFPPIRRDLLPPAFRLPRERREESVLSLHSSANFASAVLRALRDKWASATTSASPTRQSSENPLAARCGFRATPNCSNDLRKCSLSRPLFILALHYYCPRAPRHAGDSRRRANLFKTLRQGRARQATAARLCVLQVWPKRGAA